jgi:hypothetical protein
VSLDKALEVNHLSARVGDNVEIKCDVTGTPPPPIVWRRNEADLAGLNEDEVRVFSDGSLYLTRIQLIHAGNYTCHAQRNKDVVQTHVLTVHSKCHSVAYCGDHVCPSVHIYHFKNYITNVNEILF